MKLPKHFAAVRALIPHLAVLAVAKVIAADAVSAKTASAPLNDSIDEIIVTAGRREEKLDRVPISVTAFSQKTMDKLHIESFSDLASIVPGLIVSTPQSGVQGLTDVAIRGIFSGGNAPTTQFYIDEAPIAIRRQDGAGPAGSPHIH